MKAYYSCISSVALKMKAKNRNGVVAVVLVAAGLASAAYYSHLKKQQEIAEAKVNAFTICSFFSSAAAKAISINDAELPAIAARAGLDPYKVRLGMVSPEEGHAALSNAGLLAEWDAVLGKTRTMVEKAKAQDVECNKKQEQAIKFLRENDAFPSIP